MGDNNAHIKRTSQSIDNFGFDEEYLKPTVEILTENEEGTALTTQKTIAKESTLQSIAGMNIPAHDTQIVDETDPDNVVITYKKDGVTVATKTIAITGSITTISI